MLKHVAGSSQEAGRLHQQTARLAYHLNDYDDALAEFEQARGIAEPLGDEPTVASSQIFSGGILLVTGEIDRGSELAPHRCRGRGPPRPLPAGRRGAGACGRSPTRWSGDFENEREMHLARLAVARAHGDVARTADALEVLAEIALDEADAATARSYAEEALAIAQPGLPVEAREALIALARAAVAEGDLASAAATLGQGFRIGREDRPEAGDRPVLPRRGVPGRGPPRTRDGRAAVRCRPPVGGRPESGTDVPMEADLASGLEEARAALEPSAFAREWTLGTSLPTARVRELLHALAAAVPV